ncbi:hypothetical protein [Dongia deserti]|nr:hypothetical protein [Dongia deserti]
MSKGRKRGNREPKKPKQAKPKAFVAAETTVLAQGKLGAFGPGKKRW